MEIKKDPIKKRNSEPEFNYSALVAHTVRFSNSFTENLGELYNLKHLLIEQEIVGDSGGSLYLKGFP